jgi:SAM-dependent methyltransferase
MDGYFALYYCFYIGVYDGAIITAAAAWSFDMVISRREYLMTTSSSSWIAPTLISSSDSSSNGAGSDIIDRTSMFAAAEEEDEDRVVVVSSSSCANGALAMEQAIPGAYQHICMMLPTRTIRVGTEDGKKDIIIRQRPIEKDSLAGSTGVVVWNSSILLAKLLEALTWEVSNKQQQQQTVLELGCGTGLASIVVAACWGKGPSSRGVQIVATDGNPSVVELATENVRLNGYTKLIQTSVLKWNWFSAMEYADSADLVIGADLTYFSGNWPALAETMATVVKKPNGKILYLSLGHSGFNAEMDGFLAVASSYGLVIETQEQPWTEKRLIQLLWDQLTPNDRAVVMSTGGVRIIVLRHKFR